MTDPKKVLIADDLEDFRMLLKCILMGIKNIKTLLAVDGKEALAMMINDNPDVALIDWQMPGMSGVEAVREAKRQGFKNITILVTASAMGEEIKKVAKEFDDVLVKPFLCDDLISKVKKALGTKKAADRIEREYRQ